MTAIEKLNEWMASPAAAVASMPYETARELASELTAMQAKLDAAEKMADAVETYRDYQGASYGHGLGTRWLDEKLAAYRAARRA
jgi:hypothetical protein